MSYEFLVFRFLTGLSASSYLSAGGGTVADLLPKEWRDVAMALFIPGPLFGPVVLGPIIICVGDLIVVDVNIRPLLSPVLPFSSHRRAVIINSASQTYIVDMFGHQAGASALAAVILVRSVTGAFLPLAAPSLYANLGLDWTNGVLSFLTVAFIPVPFFFYRRA
ncbi:hypothetical protein F5B21DRAFT_529162 [Xylaria acuta]|nr:hypothetical protein F5B21DRAFT_529162 [Xylaria acuta]